MQKVLNRIFLLIIILIVPAKEIFTQSWITGPWAYRQKITISNPGGTILNDFQVKITLNSLFEFSSANSNGSDIRITDKDDSLQLPFWIEEWSLAQDSAVIWVRIPVIPANGTSVYIYYGNSSAVSASDGTATFKFFDDFSKGDSSGNNWIRKLTLNSGNWGPGPELAHDWKYSMEMLHGVLEFEHYHRWDNSDDSLMFIDSLSVEVEHELNYIHSQINIDGTVVPDKYITAEPQYCYGLILSNLAMGYRNFLDLGNDTLSDRCYNDMVKVFDYLSTTYPDPFFGTSPFPYDSGGYGWLLLGFSNAWHALRNDTRASLSSTIVQNYAAAFISTQAPDGSWIGANNIAENIYRDFGLLYANQIHNDNQSDTTYTFSVNKNIDYIIANYFKEYNGGLEWYPDSTASDRFLEYHQQLFIIAVRRLNGQSGGRYNHMDEGHKAWLFLTDNNFAGIDMYVNNFTNHNAFFSYRDVKEDGTFQQEELWKGSYEVGTAIWSMAINYDWVSNYQSSHSTQPHNYLEGLILQTKKPPSNHGFLRGGGYYPSAALWNRIASPNISIVPDNANPVVSISGTGTEEDIIASIDNNFNNFILEMKVKMNADANNICTPEIFFRSSDSENGYVTRLRGESQNDLFINRIQNSVLTSPPSFMTYNYSANNYFKYKVAANNSTIALSIDDSLISWNDTGTGILLGGIRLTNHGSTNSTPVYYDDVRIRSYSAIEPVSTGIGEQEVNPLPVELSSLSVKIIGTMVKLNWRTETEINNFGFNIERMILKQSVKGGLNDNTNWEKIGFVEGYGNSNSPKNYSFEDKNIVPGKYSYRLKQIDNDGSFEYSETIKVDFNSITKFELNQNYPNPFNPSTKISWQSPVGSHQTLKIYDVLGKEVVTLVDEYREAGSYEIDFQSSVGSHQLANGVYFYRLQAGDYTETKKMLLMK